MYENDMYEKNTPPYLQQNSMARASFTLGIISVLLCSIFYVEKEPAIRQHCRSPPLSEFQNGLILNILEENHEQK